MADVQQRQVFMAGKIFKTLVYFVSAIVLLLAIIAAVTQTRPFKNWLRDQMTSLSQETINGKLQLGRIDGNLLTRLTLSDVTITQEQDTVIYVPRLQVTMQPFALLKQELRLSIVRLHAPRLLIKQLADSSLNISHLLHRGAGATSLASPRPVAVDIGEFSLQHARISYRSLDTTRSLEIVRAAVRGRFVNNRLSLAIDDLQLNTWVPDLHIENVQAQIFASSDSLRFTDFSIRTSNSHVWGDLAIHSLAAADFTLDIRLDSLLLEELQPFLPSLGITGAVNGRVRATKLSGILGVEADMQHRKTSARVAGTYDLTDSSYAIDAVVRQLDLGAFGIESGHHSVVNARLTAEGRNIAWPHANGRAIAWIDSSRVAGFWLPRMDVEAELAAGRLRTRVNYYSSLGTAEVTADVHDIFGAQIYDFRVALTDFDLKRFLEETRAEKVPYAANKSLAWQPPRTEQALDAARSRLSLICTGLGRSFDPAKMEMSAILHAFAGKIGSTALDSLRAGLRVHDRKVEIDSSRWHSPTARIDLAGEISFDLKSKLRFQGELGDLELIQQLVEADSLRAEGRFSGTAIGQAESLLVKADFALRDLQWNRNNFQRVNGKMTYSARAAGGTITVRGGGLVLGIVPVDTATALIRYDPDEMDIQSSFARGQQDYGEIDGHYTFGDSARLDIRRAEFFLLGQVWKSPDDAVWIDIGEEVYHLHKIVLSSGAQRVFAEGRLDYLGEEDLRLGIENINIASIAAFLGRSGDFEGVLNANARLLGTASAPLLQGKFDLRDARIAEFRFPRAQGTIGYADERFFWDFELAQNATRTVFGEGFIPMNLALDNYGDILFVDRPMRIQFSSNGLDLSFLQALLPRVKQLNGVLTFNVALENSLQKPLTLGFVRITNGGFSVPKYGIEYRNMQMSVVVDTSLVELQSFEVASGDGKLRAEGRMNFTSAAISGIDASLRAENFTVVRNREIDLRINADIRVGGTLNEAGFAGDVAVARSRFFLPALQPTTVIQVDEKLPGTIAADSQKVAGDRLANLLKNSYGELRVLIPRNTWLRGPEINVEIEGELDLVVDAESLLLFGTINVVRGTYELYGNKFAIEKGSLTFQGSKDMVPEINLEATRAFRNLRTKEKQTLRIKITGNPNAPKIVFQRDEDAIEEKDALAYLLFGVSFEDLTQGQRTEVAGQDDSSPVMSAASGLLTGLISKQISNSLAKGLDLDVIEFQSGQDLDLKQSSVLVGKYITNDLFLSYSRDFSSGDAQRVALEYEIAKFLFLQAAKSNEKDTGFDLIWKWEW